MVLASRVLTVPGRGAFTNTISLSSPILLCEFLFGPRHQFLNQSCRSRLHQAALNRSQDRRRQAARRGQHVRVRERGPQHLPANPGRPGPVTRRSTCEMWLTANEGERFFEISHEVTLALLENFVPFRLQPL